VKIKYEDWAPGTAALRTVEQAETICADYARQGYDLTLRQLYYQFVARDLIPNTQQSYKNLGSIINRARLAGLLDWNYIVDRTRNLRGVSHWTTPASVINSAAYGFRLDKWADQPTRVEIWVEKEALAGVVERVGTERDVDYFSCRGYVSQSELWGAGQRLKTAILADQNVVILHLGDHDPSGVDMTRDITDRLTQFIGYRAERRLEVRRIALNMDQVQRYNPPPNPAKLTDSRATGYIAEHGHESWELDALDPATLSALITSHIDDIVDHDLYEAQQAAEAEHRQLLTSAAERWTEVVDFLAGAR
jgi:hypothetical protein